MKIFYTGLGCREKVNFVDRNNVLVGFDWNHQCCEQYSFYITREPLSTETAPYDIEDEKTLEPFIFDVNYCETVSIENDSPYDNATLVRFRLTHENEEIFLHLYNIHNGYYSHGITCSGNEIFANNSTSI